MFGPGLHPPLPTVRINHNLLLWSSVADPSRDRVDSLSSTLRRRRQMGELDGWGAVLLGTASLSRKGETQSAQYKDKRPCELQRRDAYRAPRSAAYLLYFKQIRPLDFELKI